MPTAPPEVAQRVRDIGVVKARRDTRTTLVRAVLAGAFISLGALSATVITSGSELGFGPTRLLVVGAFSLGLILVTVAGAELFTGNNLLAMAWASWQVSFAEVVRNWGLVYLGNTVGVPLTVALAFVGGVHELGGGLVGETLVKIGTHNTGLDPAAMLALGVLCNGLVCLAVWLAMAGRTVVDKVVAILFPVSAFVAMGLEHSIANLFFLPYAGLLDPRGESCGNCAPCRIGTAQLARQRDRESLERLLDTLELGSLCGFGQGVPRPIRDLIAHFPGELFGGAR